MKETENNNKRMLKSGIRFMRLDAMCEQLSISRFKARKIASDADALYKIDRVLLIDMDKVDNYISKFFLVEEG